MFVSNLWLGMKIMCEDDGCKFGSVFYDEVVNLVIWIFEENEIGEVECYC